MQIPDHAFFENDKGQFETHPLLGNGANRSFKLYRTEFPAIFRFDGQLYMEHFDIDHDVEGFLKVKPEHVEHLLEAKP